MLKTRCRIGGPGTDTPRLGEACHAYAERLTKIATENPTLTWREVAITGGMWKPGETNRGLCTRNEGSWWAMGTRLAVQSYCLQNGLVFPKRTHGKRAFEA